MHSVKISESRRASRAYIIEATCENFVYALASGVFLARIATDAGISDVIVGILSSMVSLASGFQLFSVFVRRSGRVKNKIILLHILNEAFFAVLYVLPMIRLPVAFKTVLFVILLLFGHGTMYTAIPTKATWLMSYVGDGHRGEFTAKKHIILLVTGIVWSYLTGTLYDACEAANNKNLAYVLLGLGILGISVVHVIALFSAPSEGRDDDEASRTPPDEKSDGTCDASQASAEVTTAAVSTSAEGEGVTIQASGSKDPAPQASQESKKQSILLLFSDRTFLKILLMFIIMTVGKNIAIGFISTYQIKELGFSMALCSVMAAIGSLCRALAERPLGVYADRHSFTKMMYVSLIFLLASLITIVFINPFTAIVLFPVYSALHQISCGGIANCSINLPMELMKENSTAAIAVKGGIIGVFGFLATLITSPLLPLFQSLDISILGVKIYAQQVLALIGAIAIIPSLLISRSLIGRRSGEPSDRN